MPKVKVDMTGAKKDIEALPSAVYPLQILEIEQKTGKDSGFPYLNVTCQIIDGEYEGRRAFGMVTLPDPGRKPEGNASARRSYGKFLVAVGEDPETDDYDTDDAIGARVNGNIVKETNEETGEERSSIKTFMPYNP